MNETEYHRISEDSINSLSNALEAVDASGALDVEYEHGVLTISLPGSKQLLVSKHTASRQLWLSSPISGGLHFRFKDDAWVLPDGRELHAVLSQELKALSNIEIVFS